jgi:hypothetical protein
MKQRLLKIAIAQLLIFAALVLFLKNEPPTRTNNYNLEYFTTNEFQGRVLHLYEDANDRGAVVISLLFGSDTMVLFN